MSASTEYEHYLEQLIVKTLLPVYEKHCCDNQVDLYRSGVPNHLLTRAKEEKRLPALFRKKQSGC